MCVRACLLVFSDAFNPKYPPYKLHFYPTSKAILVAKRACIHCYTANLIHISLAFRFHYGLIQARPQQRRVKWISFEGTHCASFLYFVSIKSPRVASSWLPLVTMVTMATLVALDHPAIFAWPSQLMNLLYC